MGGYGETWGKTMTPWFMLTVIGKDQAGIVARVTGALYDDGCNLGEASMMRLGANFTIMLMVEHAGTAATLKSLLADIGNAMELHIHVDEVSASLHQHVMPDVRISVHGADRAGIVAQVTQALANAGLNILDLESDVAGTEEQPIYIMHIEGQAEQGVESLQGAIDAMADSGIEVRLNTIQTLIG